jgi:hypothetical protein
MVGAESASGKLESPLQAMYDAWKAKGKTGLRDEASARGVDLHSNRVSVRIAVTGEEIIPMLRKTLVQNGAHITATEGSSVFADVPIPHLSRLAASQLVVGIYIDRPQQRPQAKQD